MHFLSEFNLRELLSSFVVLLAITDIPGNLPIVINLQNKGIKISARRAFIYSLVLLVFFFYAGEAFSTPSTPAARPRSASAACPAAPC